MAKQRAFPGIRAAILAGFACSWAFVSGAYAKKADPCSKDAASGVSDDSNVSLGSTFQDLQDLAGTSADAIQVDPTQVDTPDSDQQPCAAKSFVSAGGTSASMKAPSDVFSSAEDINTIQLFGQWGVDKDVFQFPKDGTATTSPRTYSIRLVSYWALPDVSTPTWQEASLVDRIAIYDITDPANVYGKTFDLSGNSGSAASGGVVLAGQPFQLDTRSYANVTPRSYTLTIGPNGQVNFTLQASSQVAANSSGQTLTIDQLRQIRYQRALQTPTLRLAGIQYYLVPQSAGMGCWQFFNSNSVEPVLFGCVNQKLAGEQETMLATALAGTEYFGHVSGQSFCIAQNAANGVFGPTVCRGKELYFSTAKGTQAVPAPQPSKISNHKKTGSSGSGHETKPSSGPVSSKPQKPATTPSKHK